MEALRTLYGKYVDFLTDVVNIVLIYFAYCWHTAIPFCVLTNVFKYGSKERTYDRTQVSTYYHSINLAEPFK